MSHSGTLHAPPQYTCQLNYLAASATGEKLPLLVIGKVRSPDVSRTLVHCHFSTSLKKELNGFGYIHRIKELDMFLSNGRKVVLIVDNCLAYPEVLDLQAIELIFLPTNTTSVTQSMD